MMKLGLATEPNVLRAVDAFEAGRQMAAAGVIDIDWLMAVLCEPGDPEWLRGSVGSMAPSLIARHGEDEGLRRVRAWVAENRRQLARAARRRARGAAT